MGNPCKNGHQCFSNSSYDDSQKDYTCNCSKGFLTTDKNCENCN